MNIWQIMRQLEYLIASRKWEDDAGNEEVILPVPTAGTPKRAANSLTLPFVLITPLGGPADEEDPDIWDESVRFVIVSGQGADPTGKAALIGGSRASGQGSSHGRGLLELQEEVLAAINQLGKDLGVVIQGRNARSGEAFEDDDFGYIVNRQLFYDVRCTSFRYYHPCRVFAAVDGASGEADLTWNLPPDRFDRRKLMLRRASGSTPPADTSSGTEVALGSDLPTSFTDDPGAGTWSYSLFAGYLETSDDMPPTSGDPDRWSEKITATVVVT